MSEMMVSCATIALKYNMLAKYSINDEIVVGVDSTKGRNHVLLAGFREHITVCTNIILISIMAVKVVGGIQPVDYSATD